MGRESRDQVKRIDKHNTNNSCPTKDENVAVDNDYDESERLDALSPLQSPCFSPMRCLSPVQQRVNSAHTEPAGPVYALNQDINITAETQKKIEDLEQKRSQSLENDQRILEKRKNARSNTLSPDVLGRTKQWREKKGVPRELNEQMQRLEDEKKEAHRIEREKLREERLERQRQREEYERQREAVMKEREERMIRERAEQRQREEQRKLEEMENARYTPDPSQIQMNLEEKQKAREEREAEVGEP